MPTDRDFEDQIAALESLAATDVWRSIEGLRAAREAFARHVAGVAPSGELVARVRDAVERGLAPDLAERAAAHLALAEDAQWKLGSLATGSGEGLASMAEVRALQLARAWLLSVPADTASRDRSLALASEVERDSNRVAERLAPHVAALRARLGAR